MVQGVLFIIGLIAIHFVVKWWDDQNIDKSPMTLTGGGIESDVNQATEKRRTEKKRKLEEEVRRLNEQHPGRIFYRDGPRIKEHTPEEVAAIQECEKLNAPYPPRYPRYWIKNGRVEYKGWAVEKYKYEAKTLEMNRDPSMGSDYHFDHANMRIIDKVTGEEIPFDPDNYRLPQSYFRH